MIEILLNDRVGKKLRIKCMPDDNIGVVKQFAAALTGTRPEKIVLKRQHEVLKDHITLDDYEIHDGSCVDLYYN